jgi:hypothetical protein
MKYLCVIFSPTEISRSIFDLYFSDVLQVFKRNEDVKENNNQPPSNVEFILDDDDCPLSILMNCPPSQGKTIVYVFDLMYVLLSL